MNPHTDGALSGTVNGSVNGSAGDEVTRREIEQQPALWRALPELLAANSPALEAFLGATRASRVVLTGAGTSAFVGQILAPALTRRLGRRVDAVATTDIVSSPAEVFAEDVPTLLVSFARSGDSPESLAATRLADRLLSSVRHLIVTCDVEGALAREHAGDLESYVLAMPEAANDRGFAMTSSFTTMLLSTWFVLGEVTPAERRDLAERLASVGSSLLGSPSPVADLAGSYDRVVYLGSGGLGGLARESALKLLELTAGRMVGFHDTSLGFRHGPKAVLDGRTLAVVYLSGDAYARRYDEDMVAELRAALGKSHVLVVGAGGEATVVLEGVDGVDDALLAAPYVLVAQRLALESSLAAGLTPDNPFPDGEVNRVVRGVTVYPLPA